MQETVSLQLEYGVRVHTQISHVHHQKLDCEQRTPEFSYKQNRHRQRLYEQLIHPRSTNSSGVVCADLDFEMLTIAEQVVSKIETNACSGFCFKLHKRFLTKTILPDHVTTPLHTWFGNGLKFNKCSFFRLALNQVKTVLSFLSVINRLVSLVVFRAPLLQITLLTIPWNSVANSPRLSPKHANSQKLGPRKRHLSFPKVPQILKGRTNLSKRTYMLFRPYTHASFRCCEVSQLRLHANPTPTCLQTPYQDHRWRVNRIGIVPATFPHKQS